MIYYYSYLKNIWITAIIIIKEKMNCIFKRKKTSLKLIFLFLYSSQNKYNSYIKNILINYFRG